MANTELKTLKDLIFKWKTTTEKDIKSILISKGKSNSRIIKWIKIKTSYKNNNIEATMDLPNYATYLDKGRLPGKQPPLKVITAWCVRKNIDKRAAYPIARKIGRFGLPATNFLDPWNKFSKMFQENSSKITAEFISIIREQLSKNQKITKT